MRKKGRVKQSFPNKPLVSVITVVLNGEKYLEETIQGVLNQSYDNIEYIVIDGGSTDRTVDIIRQHEDHIDYWVSEADQGISDAFNKGINSSTGPIIGIINAGDWYELDTVERIVSATGDGAADIVHGQLQYWRDQEKTDLVMGNHCFLYRDMTVNHMTVFIKRALYDRLGGYSSVFRYAMDYEFLLRAKNNGAIFLYIDRCLANMRRGGLSDTGWRKALREVAQAKRLQNSSPFIATWVYYVFSLVKGSAQRILVKVGMVRLVRLYHSRFSLVRKVAVRN